MQRHERALPSSARQIESIEVRACAGIGGDPFHAPIERRVVRRTRILPILVAIRIPTGKLRFIRLGCERIADECSGRFAAAEAGTFAGAEVLDRRTSRSFGNPASFAATSARKSPPALLCYGRMRSASVHWRPGRYREKDAATQRLPHQGRRSRQLEWSATKLRITHRSANPRYRHGPRIREEKRRITERTRRDAQSKSLHRAHRSPIR